MIDTVCVRDALCKGNKANKTKQNHICFAAALAASAALASALASALALRSEMSVIWSMQCSRALLTLCAAKKASDLALPANKQALQTNMSTAKQSKPTLQQNSKTKQANTSARQQNKASKHFSIAQQARDPQGRGDVLTGFADHVVGDVSIAVDRLETVRPDGRRVGPEETCKSKRSQIQAKAGKH